MAVQLLSTEQAQIIAALAHGATLKVHRTVDGDKSYALHPLDGAAQKELTATAVDSLLKKRLIVSNMKFPAATFLLTERGVTVAARWGLNENAPLASRLEE